MRRLAIVGCLLFASAALADGPKDNLPDAVRRIPPPGVKIPDADRRELLDGLHVFAGKLTKFEPKPSVKDRTLIADVDVLGNAVMSALTHDEFYSVKDVAAAKNLLKLANDRADQLAAGKSPWAEQTGLVVRGYVSVIDGSVQPYGLVVPASYKPGSGKTHRIDLWCHGRGETLTELAFLDQRLKSPGEFTPPDAFVLHLYGRYCCANKFAGDIDLLEALADVERRYPIDASRRVIRGFSMGGAACWQFATHYPSLWCAAAPGAGFAESAEFLKVFQNEPVKPSAYEQKLWHLYNATDYAANLFNVPTVAYSGAKDRQKQAADIMAKALKDEGMELVHVIGPDTEHKYHPESKKEINRRIDELVAKGRDDSPKKVRFTTWTLRYPESNWVKIEGMGEHWTRARVDAERSDPGQTTVKTENVTALTLTGSQPPAVGSKVMIDGQQLTAATHFVKRGDKWEGAAELPAGLRKKPGLQGPIDDAFMGSFLMVRPTGQALHPAANAWATAELAHAVDHWRRQFRGEARVKDDTAVGDADIADHNLILWGDPGSNAVLKKIADKLPVEWTSAGVKVGDASYPGGTHAPAFVYPNPLNPNRYVVVNSGFTFREYDYLNNARQVPKLPDWAVYDVTVPPTSRHAAGVKAAGFFDEAWRVKGGKP